MDKRYITEQKYKTMKAVSDKMVASGATPGAVNKALMSKFHIGTTTAQAIRNTPDYRRYRENSFKFHGGHDRKCVPKATKKANGPDSGFDFKPRYVELPPELKPVVPGMKVKKKSKTIYRVMPEVPDVFIRERKASAWAYRFQGGLALLIMELVGLIIWAVLCVF